MRPAPLLFALLLSGWIGAASASVCGEKDKTQDVEFYDGLKGPPKESVRAWQASAGLIRWNSDLASVLNPGDDPGMVAGIRWCSGTLVRDHLLLTAGHCLDPQANVWLTPQRRRGSITVPLNPEELAPLMHVDFSFQRDATKCENAAEPATCKIRTSDIYPIARLIAHRQRNLNFAILELGPNSDGRLPQLPARMDYSSAALVETKLLAIIQHPGGEPKRIGWGTQFRISNDRIFYRDIDTFGGSAGAGILDQDGRLIGLHTNGGCSPAGGENSGITLRAIMPEFQPLNVGR